MHKIDSQGATAGGLFKETPAPATRVAADWLNACQTELVNVVTHALGGNAALNKADTAQLLTAILAMIARGIEGALTIEVDAGDEKTITFMGGLLILKQGYFREALTNEVVRSVGFQTPFPQGCWSVVTQDIINVAGIYRDLRVQVINPTRTTAGFSVQLQSDNDAHGDMALDGFDWWAIGN